MSREHEIMNIADLNFPALPSGYSWQISEKRANKMAVPFHSVDLVKTTPENIFVHVLKDFFMIPTTAMKTVVVAYMPVGYYLSNNPREEEWRAELGRAAQAAFDEAFPKAKTSASGPVGS